MKNFIILAGLLMVLGMPQAYAKEAAKEGDAAAAHPEFEYIKLEPITLPIITNKGLTQQVSFIVQLEIDWGKKEAIAAYEPRLVDAYLQDLYGAFGAGRGLMKDNFVNVDTVKQRLSSVTDKVLGPEHKVRAVLLQALQQRPM